MNHRTTLRSLSSWLACSILLCTAVPGAGARAATLADVRIVDRHTGQRLTIHRHQGEYWVAGRPGASYSVDIANQTGERIMAVVSVDGVNAITGKTASAAPRDGYVFDAWQNWGINGWRKSDSEVAAFYFSESSASYASRTGRPRDVGVIGVALFRERPASVAVEPPWTPRRGPALEEREDARSANSESSMESTIPVPAPSAADPRASERKAAEATAKRSPSLGTGHGAIETSRTVTVDFEPATRHPEQIVRIRYDSHANLVARGVIRAPRGERVPDPFPGSGRNGYVPDPPRW